MHRRLRDPRDLREAGHREGRGRAVDPEDGLEAGLCRAAGYAPSASSISS